MTGAFLTMQQGVEASRIVEMSYSPYPTEELQLLEWHQILVPKIQLLM